MRAHPDCDAWRDAVDICYGFWDLVPEPAKPAEVGPCYAAVRALEAKGKLIWHDDPWREAANWERLAYVAEALGTIKHTEGQYAGRWILPGSTQVARLARTIAEQYAEEATL